MAWWVKRNKDMNDPEQNKPAQDGAGTSPDFAEGHAAREGEHETDADAHAGITERVAELEIKLAEAEGNYKRALADYHNYHRRAMQNEVQAKLQGMAAVVTSTLTVLDHFDLALTLDPSKATASQVIEGVKVIRDELLRVLQGHGVGLITPRQGDPFEPGKHEAVMQQPVEGVGPNLVASLFQPGYTLAVAGVERVVRPAKVAVTPAA
jgi:molecular chaperone GrpE